MTSSAAAHERYSYQATWTHAIRDRLFSQIEMPRRARLLEVGCGTGVINAELAERFASPVLGADINPSAIRYARGRDKVSIYLVADGLDLPLANAAFDMVVCHFLLLWVKNPLRALEEMVRTVKPGGWVLALAEPDYGGRIDYPQELSRPGELQTKALQAQGADPFLGRRLRGLFQQAGLQQVRTGILGGEWEADIDKHALSSELETLQTDLKGLIPDLELNTLLADVASAWRSGAHTLFVPTFYASGKAP